MTQKKGEKEHLVDREENEHETRPKATGCLWRHADSGDKTYPRCDDRRNAHDSSKASEQHINNIPTFRCPSRWVEEWTYNFGPNRFVQEVNFTDGKLPQVLAAGYGK